MYVAIDRKPENGCEIQDAACGKSGVMICLKLVKTATEQQATSPYNDEDDGLTHGTRVLKELISPWFHSDRVVCADSYFASVKTAEELKRFNMRFMVLLKQKQKSFRRHTFQTWSFVIEGIAEA
jgi:Transposase IS4